MNKEEYKGIFVFAEQREGEIKNVAFELIGKARELAEAVGEDVTALSADTVAGSSALITNCGDLTFDENGALSLRPYEAVALAW